jgi:hypothetical protein
MDAIQGGQQDTIEWFKQVIAEDPKIALTFLVGADLAIPHGQFAVEWRKPNHPAVVMYRNTVQA